MDYQDKRYSKTVPLWVPLAKVVTDAQVAYAGTVADSVPKEVSDFELLDFLIAEANNPREAVDEFLADVLKRERDALVKQVREFCGRYNTPLEGPERACLTRLAAELEESVGR